MIRTDDTKVNRIQQNWVYLFAFSLPLAIIDTMEITVWVWHLRKPTRWEFCSGQNARLTDDTTDPGKKKKKEKKVLCQCLLSPFLQITKEIKILFLNLLSFQKFKLHKESLPQAQRELQFTEYLVMYLSFTCVVSIHVPDKFSSYVFFSPF